MNEWIKWNGGECPVHPKTEVKVQLRDGTEPNPNSAGCYRWVCYGKDSDIVAYRVVKEVKYRFVKGVPGCIECSGTNYEHYKTCSLYFGADKVVGHPHAALMAEYAEVAKTNPRPWEEFEYSDGSNLGWIHCIKSPEWLPEHNYRRKPKQKKVRVYQWIRKNSFTAFVDSELFREGTTPTNAIQRIEPGFEIEVGRMNNDKELLELAAKAAGIKLQWSDLWQEWYDFESRNEGKDFCSWNPLTDDGDALRLAVKLNMGISIPIFKKPRADVITFRNSLVNVIEEGDDPYAATRRAIVRAAAEIGKGVK